jgi:hypothetical protein
MAPPAWVGAPQVVQPSTGRPDGVDKKVEGPDAATYTSRAVLGLLGSPGYLRTQRLLAIVYASAAATLQ